MKDYIIIIVSLILAYFVYLYREEIFFSGKNIASGKLSVSPNVSGKNCGDLLSVPTGVNASEFLGLTPREYYNLVQGCTGVGPFQDQQLIQANRTLDLNTKRLIEANYASIQALPIDDPLKIRLGYKNTISQKISVIINSYIEAAKIAYLGGWNGIEKGRSIERVLFNDYQITVNYHSFD